MDSSENSSTKQPTTPCAGIRVCGQCRKDKHRHDFSKTQWKKGSEAKCKTCTESAGGGGGNGNGTHPNNHKRNGSSNKLQSNNSNSNHPPTPTPISLQPRPLKPVPGFDGLQVCRDWPPRPSGSPPPKQSAIFIPLLVCSMGEALEGFCTLAQLELAVKWWSLVFPSWPHWMQAIKISLNKNMDLKNRLFSTAKGRPMLLIPKTTGRGKVPHFNGRLQEEILELTPEVALQVYACITCLYDTNHNATVVENE